MYLYSKYGRVRLPCTILIAKVIDIGAVCGSRNARKLSVVKRPNCCFFRGWNCPDTASTLPGLALHRRRIAIDLICIRINTSFANFNTYHSQTTLGSSKKRNKYLTRQDKRRSTSYPEQQITTHEATILWTKR